jgi:hypothetical protein
VRASPPSARRRLVHVASLGAPCGALPVSGRTIRRRVENGGASMDGPRGARAFCDAQVVPGCVPIAAGPAQAVPALADHPLMRRLVAAALVTAFATWRHAEAGAFCTFDRRLMPHGDAVGRGQTMVVKDDNRLSDHARTPIHI